MPYSPRRPTRRLAAPLALLLVAAVFPPPARAASTKDVDAALGRAKAYLYTLQKNGTWDASPTRPKPVADPLDAQRPDGGQWTGQTALAVYALLAAGESPRDPRLAAAIDFLVKTEPVGVYALGVRMQVWLLLPRSDAYRAAARRDAKVLLESVRTTGPAAGMYDYLPTGRTYSHSRAQYGVLGAWAAEQLGIEVPDAYWALVERAWVGHQAADGGWAYKSSGPAEYPVTPGMTAVGVATLLIAQDYTRGADGAACNGNPANPAVDRGLAWMGKHMNLVATDETYPRDYPYATLYAVERIGVAGGVKYLGTVDWYRKGAGWLLANQNKSGGWGSPGGGFMGPVADTAFATLFLARGRAPVAFAKLDYGRGQTGPAAPPWNQRPRDVANVARWVGGQVERDLAWQVVPATAPPADLAEAPVLYVSGNKGLAFDEAERANLRAYVEAGGLIVGNADCGTAAFAASFRQLAHDLFPAYEMRPLPPEHPLFTGNFPRAKWRTKPVVLGVSNGVRELMLLVPQADPARQWQARAVAGKEEFWQLAGAIFLYVSEGKDLRYRGETHLVMPDPKVTPTRTLAVHRIQHAANWDPEPGGWRRMVGVARNDLRIDLTVSPAKLAANALPAGGAAHLTGTAKFTLTPEQRGELKRFAEAGGTLLVDAAGGSAAFAAAAEAELAQIFPGNAMAVLPEDHPLFAPGGKKIDPVRYRRLAQKVAGQLRAPRLKGIEVGGRLAVVYSREDLSAGMVGQSVEGVTGYDPASATELVAAVFAYAAGAEAPTTRPVVR